VVVVGCEKGEDDVSQRTLQNVWRGFLQGLQAHVLAQYGDPDAESDE
jgi:hypothetical protein